MKKSWWKLKNELLGAPDDWSNNKVFTFSMWTTDIIPTNKWGDAFSDFNTIGKFKAIYEQYQNVDKISFKFKYTELNLRTQILNQSWCKKAI